MPRQKELYTHGRLSAVVPLPAEDYVLFQKVQRMVFDACSLLYGCWLYRESNFLKVEGSRLIEEGNSLIIEGEDQVEQGQRLVHGGENMERELIEIWVLIALGGVCDEVSKQIADNWDEFAAQASQVREYGQKVIYSALETIRKGKSMVKKGRARQEQGERKMAEGLELIRQGQNTIIIWEV